MTSEIGQARNGVVPESKVQGRQDCVSNAAGGRERGGQTDHRINHVEWAGCPGRPVSVGGGAGPERRSSEELETEQNHIL